MQDANELETPDECPVDDWACVENCDVQQYSLIRQCDVAGLLHCHTSYAGGAHDLACIVAAAKALDLQYVGITDVVRTAHNGEGLVSEDILKQRDEIRRFNEGSKGPILLHGVEMEAGVDGSLPMEDLDLDLFDFVIVTLRETNGLDRDGQTARALRSVMNPFVSILGHPYGEWMTSGEELPVDLDAILRAAATTRVAVEIDANPGHPELDWTHCYRAQKLGVPMVIGSDAHRAARLGDYRHGVELTRQAGFCCWQILNTRPLEDIREFFQC